MMSCRTARLSAWITSLRGAQVGDFQVATGGGFWVATGEIRASTARIVRVWLRDADG